MAVTLNGEGESQAELKEMRNKLLGVVQEATEAAAAAINQGADPLKIRDHRDRAQQANAALWRVNKQIGD